MLGLRRANVLVRAERFFRMADACMEHNPIVETGKYLYGWDTPDLPGLAWLSGLAGAYGHRVMSVELAPSAMQNELAPHFLAVVQRGDRMQDSLRCSPSSSVFTNPFIKQVIKIGISTRYRPKIYY